MRRASTPLTVLAEIDPDKRDELEYRLLMIRRGIDEFRPEQLPQTHFTRFVIIEDPTPPSGERLPPLLAWECNHDGTIDEYLAAVAEHAPTIDRVFGCCARYPRRGAADFDEWSLWIRDRMRRSVAFYTAYGDISHEQVLNDRAIHEALRAIIDRDRPQLCRLPPAEVRRHLLTELRASRPDLDLSRQSEGTLRWAFGKAVAIALLLLALPLALVVFLPWYVTLRAKERADASTSGDTYDPRELWIAEDHFTQNQLTHVVDIKPGWFRLVTLCIVLTVIDVLARFWYVHGDLGGIQTIHFARWVLALDRRPDPPVRRHRLVFFSNYDGSWENYLGEFIDRAAGALTAVWSNTVGFPATHDLRKDGAKDEETFKRWTREHQLPTHVWWTGISGSTVQNVRNDLWIRRRLERPLDDDEVKTWLRRL
ncbi:MAG: hypothetical protein R3B48_14500 [Kofleriaceae bacterium]